MICGITAAYKTLQHGNGALAVWRRLGHAAVDWHGSEQRHQDE
jgi:hypothetical protein